jgi:hypothetical protein
MAKKYLQVAPVPGKWYVSERFQPSATKWKIVDAAEPQPKRSMSDMIVAGPFETRALAAAWNDLTGTAGYIWERAVVED